MESSHSFKTISLFTPGAFTQPCVGQGGFSAPGVGEEQQEVGGLGAWSTLTQALHRLSQHLRVPIVIEASRRVHSSSQLWVHREVWGHP